MYTRPQLPNSVHKRHNTRRYDISLLERIALSGWGYADLHAGVNFRFIEFYEVRVLGILGSSHSSGLAPHPSPPDATQGIVHMHKESLQGVLRGAANLCMVCS